MRSLATILVLFWHGRASHVAAVVSDSCTASHCVTDHDGLGAKAPVDDHLLLQRQKASLQKLSADTKSGEHDVHSASSKQDPDLAPSPSGGPAPGGPAPSPAGPSPAGPSPSGPAPSASISTDGLVAGLKAEVWLKNIDNLAQGFDNPPAHFKYMIMPSVDFETSPIQFGDGFFMRWTGKLMISSAGEYSFALESDDGSRASVNGATVVDHDGVHGTSRKEGSPAQLASGLLDVDVRFFEKGGGEVMRWFYKGPDTSNEWASVPGTVLYTAPLTDEEANYEQPVTGDDSCNYSNDGYCDEPQYCQTGTDWTDCSTGCPPWVG